MSELTLKRYQHAVSELTIQREAWATPTEEMKRNKQTILNEQNGRIMDILTKNPNCPECGSIDLTEPMKFVKVVGKQSLCVNCGTLIDHKKDITKHNTSSFRGVFNKEEQHG